MTGKNLQLTVFNLFIVICFTWPRKLSFRLSLSGKSISEPAPRGLLAAPVSQRSKVRILYKRESFQVFFFRNCKNYFKSLLSLRNRVLRVSNGLDEPGPVNWDLALCLLLAWIICYLCVCKGVKSSGKVSNSHKAANLLLGGWNKDVMRDPSMVFISTQHYWCFNIPFLQLHSSVLIG